MDHIHLSVGDEFFDFISRKSRKSPGEVVMVIRRPNGAILLNTKGFYPNGIYRLPSGGIKRGELPEQAFHRELREETGFDAEIERALGVVHFMIDHGDQRADYISYVILSRETTGDPSPEDLDEGITGSKDIDPCELKGIAEQMLHLPDEWIDWGRFRSPGHTIAWKELCRSDPNRDSE